MPTSLNNCGSGATGTELEGLLGLDGIFAIFWATSNTPRDMRESCLVEEVWPEPAFDTTADIPPMTMPESLQEAVAERGTGDAHAEGSGKAPDMTADGGWCACFGALANDLEAQWSSCLCV